MRTLLTALAAFYLFFIPVLAQSATSCVPAPPGVVSWWPGEGAAVDAIDGNDGTLMGEAAFAAGIAGQAFSFDGMGAYVDIPGSSNIFFANDQPFTIEAWFKPESEAASFFILRNAAYGLRWQGSAGPLAFYNGNYHYSARTSWELNHWYHVALVDNGVDSVTLYIDGVLDKSDDGVLWNPNRFPCHGGDYCFALQLGGVYETQDVEYFMGKVDEVTLYDRALTGAEIQSIFAAGSQGNARRLIRTAMGFRLQMTVTMRTPQSTLALLRRVTGTMTTAMAPWMMVVTGLAMHPYPPAPICCWP